VATLVDDPSGLADKTARPVEEAAGLMDGAASLRGGTCSRSSSGTCGEVT
jgi:hypothetical protein